jgi:hypothetical protein
MYPKPTDDPVAGSVSRFELSELGRTKYRVLLKPMRPEEIVVAIEETLRNR